MPFDSETGWYYLAIFFASLCSSLLLTPVARRLAIRLEFVDRPSGRKFHRDPTPYLGGLAIWGSCMLALLVRYQFLPQFSAWAAGSLVLVLLGLWDDRSGMAPRVKLAGQVLAACFPVAFGDAFSVFGIPALDIPLTLFWIVGLTNAVNLLDNMDGLSAGTTGISCFFLFLIAAGNGQYLVGGMALGVSGACLGFLRYNFAAPAASIFMGDTGSLFLGFTLAVACLRLRLPVDGLAQFLVAAMVVGLPLLDTTTVTLLRIRAGRPVYLGGKDHCSHRLVAMGFSPRRAVLAHYAIAVVFGLLGLLASRLPSGADLPRMGLALATLAVALRIFSRLSRVAVYPTAPEAPAPNQPVPPPALELVARDEASRQAVSAG